MPNLRGAERTRGALELGERLRAHREAKGLFQREAAEGMEIPMGTYVSYERGEVETPPFEYVYRMARFYETTMEELMEVEPLAPMAGTATTAEVQRLRERVEQFEYVHIAQPYLERAHRDLGKLLEALQE